MSNVFKNTATNTTDDSYVAAQAGQRIRVTAVAIVAGGTAQSLTFKSKPSGASSAITPLFAFGANGGMVLPYNPDGWFDTVLGEGLTVTTASGGSTTGIMISYRLIGSAR
jgi:hypothetical protein